MPNSAPPAAAAVGVHSLASGLIAAGHLDSRVRPFWLAEKLLLELTAHGNFCCVAAGAGAYDFAFLHVKAVDDTGHDRLVDLKVRGAGGVGVGGGLNVDLQV